MIKITRNHPNKKWIITVIELKNHLRKFKVTRRFPELNIAETKIFYSKKKAKKQFKEWLK